jgi:hypothetical protein
VLKLVTARESRPELHWLSDPQPQRRAGRLGRASTCKASSERLVAYLGRSRDIRPSGTGEAAPLEVGRIVAERYGSWLRWLGGHGQRLSGARPGAGETVALGVLRADLAQVAQCGQRFRQEIRLARRITHRNSSNSRYRAGSRLLFITMGTSRMPLNN